MDQGRHSRRSKASPRRADRPAPRWPRPIGHTDARRLLNADSRGLREWHPGEQLAEAAGLSVPCVYQIRVWAAVMGRPEESSGGPINGSDADWADLVPLDCGSGRRKGIGGRIGADPITNSDTDAADFLPAPLTRPIQTLQRHLLRRPTLCPACALGLA
jgi:hypothetical protein